MHRCMLLLLLLLIVMNGGNLSPASSSIGKPNLAMERMTERVIWMDATYLNARFAQVRLLG